MKNPRPDAVTQLDKAETWLQVIPWVFAITPEPSVPGVPVPNQSATWMVKVLGLQFLMPMELVVTSRGNSNDWLWQPSVGKKGGPVRQFRLLVSLKKMKKDRACLHLKTELKTSEDLPLELKKGLQNELEKAWGPGLLDSLKDFLTRDPEKL